MSFTKASPPKFEEVEPRVLLSTTVEGVNTPADFGGTFSAAQAITLDSSGAAVVQGKISSTSDVDMLKIVATQTGAMTVTMAASGTSTLDSNLGVYDSSQVLMISNDNASGTTKNSAATFSVVAGRTYYLKLSQSASTTGNYQVNIATQSYTAPVSNATYVEWLQAPDSDFGNARTAATAVPLSTSGSAVIEGSIVNATDADFVKVVANASGNMTINMKHLNSNSLDPMMAVYDANGNLLGSNDDTSTTNVDSVLTVAVTGGQTYYIKMYSYGRTTGLYAATITSPAVPAPPPVTDDFGDTMATATAVTLSSAGAATVNGTIGTSTDVDFIKVVANASGNMTVNMKHQSGNSLDPMVAVYDASGTLLGSNDDTSTSNVDSLLTVAVTGGQTYYIKMYAYGGTMGPYTTTIASPAVPAPPPPVTDDFGDTMATAGAVTLSSAGTASVTGTINPATDVDFMKVVANASGNMTVNVNHQSGNSLDPMVAVYDASGTLLGSNDDVVYGNVDSQLTVAVTGGQTYYIKVSSYAGRTTGQYQVLIASPAVPAPPPPVTDDFGDTIATATTVTVNSSGAATVNGTIGTSTDVDFIKVVANASGSMTVNMLHQSGTTLDPMVAVYDASGTLLGSNDDTSTSNVDSLLTVAVTGGQTYYIKMYAYGGTMGPYTTTIASPAVPAPPPPVTDDFGDTIATATAVTLSSAGTANVNGTINTATDVDMIKMVVGQTGSMNVAMNATGSTGLDTKLSLYDTSGNLVATNDNYGSSTNAQITANVTSGATYYIGMSSSGGTTGTYSTYITIAATTPPPSGTQIPANVYAIDPDGDGYGVNAPNGPDADNNDPTVNTWAQGVAKYGSDMAFLNHLGYHPTRILYSMPDPSALLPGDLVLIPGGTVYSGNYAFGFSNVNGTAANPITIMAMPGTVVKIEGGTQGLIVKYSSYLTFDGLTIDGALSQGGYGVWMTQDNHITFNHINEYGYSLGIDGMQDMHQIEIENSVIANNAPSHGIYIGARDLPNSDIWVHNNIFFGNQNQAFQENGRCTNLVVENNIFHSNLNQAIALLEGVSNSFIRNNLIFNNGAQGIMVYDYDDSSPAILPYNQINNVIEGNTIWIGKFSPNGTTNAMGHAAIQFTDSTAADNHMLNATIRNNTLVTYGGPTIIIDNARNLSAMSIYNNTMWDTAGGTTALNVAGTDYSFSAFQALAPSRFYGNVWTDPLFVDVSINYWSTPQKFNFARR